MKNTEPTKLNICSRFWFCLRDNCFSAGSVLRNLYCTSLAKTGSKCEDIKPLGHLIWLLCIFVMFCIPYAISYTSSHFFDTSEKTPIESSSEALVFSQAASIISATTDINIEPPKADEPDVFSECDLDTGEWVKWFGKINQDFLDKSHFTLPVNSGGALFKYIGKIDDFSSCEFVFIPRSEDSINYVISLDEIYQIVIGDNDFWTVAMIATDAIGNDLIPILEDSTQKTRPRLLSKIKNGTTVKAALKQGFIDAGNYQIELVITYKPDVTTLNETQTSKFVWTFEPSPAILERPSLSIGLIRGSEDKSEIGVKFVKPSLVQQSKNTSTTDDI